MIGIYVSRFRVVRFVVGAFIGVGFEVKILLGLLPFNKSIVIRIIV
jgi:hypothetical protein